MKVKVEKLANIDSAEIELKNLTLFVGQNSTHKSYMAHVCYELFKELSRLDSPTRNWNKKNKIISSIIRKLTKNDYEYFDNLEYTVTSDFHTEQISADEWDDFEQTVVKFSLDIENKIFKEIIIKLNNLLLNEINTIINNSFNGTSTVIESIYIENEIIYNEDYSLYFDMPLEHFNEEEENISTKLLTNIINLLINSLSSKINNYDTSYYFPASRTGFVLTLDEIYAGIFRDKFRGQVSATRLGEPTIDFIQTFADIKTCKIKEPNFSNFFNIYSKDNKSKQNELVDFLEKNIIKGKIKEVKNEQDYSTYFLNVNNTDLDLHLASSATLETLPFIVFLRNSNNIEKTFFVIEEPEAHLHPKAQIQMAKFIVMLSNTGAKVLVTTHSDYILNEINNCIKTNTLKENYNTSISKDDVSAYLFKNSTNSTTVTSLDIDKFGISNENFDEVLEELLDTSGDLSERIIDNES